MKINIYLIYIINTIKKIIINKLIKKKLNICFYYFLFKE